MNFNTPLRKMIALALTLAFVPSAAMADMNGQDDQQDMTDRQDDLSANNTAFRGAKLLERGSQAYARDVKALGKDQEASMFWSGDTLNLEVRSKKTGNRMAMKIEFFWFEAGLERGSDFYVAIIRGNSSPNLGNGCTSLGKGAWSLGVDELAQYIDVKSNQSGQGGAVRWDWSIPFQTYRWEPKQDIKIEQHYALNADATASGSAQGSAGMKTKDGKEIQGKGSIKGNAGAEASHKVSTSYSVTLYRWEMKVSSGPSGIKWGIKPLDPKKATDNAYHEYYLALQSESRGQPVVIPEIEFGGNFNCSRWSVLPDKGEELKARATNIRLTPPPQPKCDAGEQLENGNCVSKCDTDEVYENGSCQPKEQNNDQPEDNSCGTDDDCERAEICSAGSCQPAECMMSDECSADEICNVRRCQQVECTRDKDCKDGEMCASDGSCVADPSADSKGDKADQYPDAGGSGPDAGSNNNQGKVVNNYYTQDSGCSTTGNNGAPSPGFLGMMLLGLAGLLGRRGSKKKARMK